MREKVRGALRGRLHAWNVVVRSEHDALVFSTWRSTIRLPWADITFARSGTFTEWCGPTYRAWRLAVPTDRLGNAIGVFCTHDSIPTVAFAPASFKNWFDELEKRGVRLDDPCGIREARNPQTFASRPIEIAVAILVVLCLAAAVALAIFN
jgi:hypothetical protein